MVTLELTIVPINSHFYSSSIVKIFNTKDRTSKLIFISFLNKKKNYQDSLLPCFFKQCPISQKRVGRTTYIYSVMVAVSHFTNDCCLQMTYKFVSPKGFSNAHAWVANMAFVLISKKCQSEQKGNSSQYSAENITINKSFSVCSKCKILNIQHTRQLLYDRKIAVVPHIACRWCKCQNCSSVNWACVSANG